MEVLISMSRVIINVLGKCMILSKGILSYKRSQHLHKHLKIMVSQVRKTQGIISSGMTNHMVLALQMIMLTPRIYF